MIVCFDSNRSSATVYFNVVNRILIKLLIQSSCDVSFQVVSRVLFTAKAFKMVYTSWMGMILFSSLLLMSFCDGKSVYDDSDAGNPGRFRSVLLSKLNLPQGQKWIRSDCHIRITALIATMTTHPIHPNQTWEFQSSTKGHEISTSSFQLFISQATFHLHERTEKLNLIVLFEIFCFVLRKEAKEKKTRVKLCNEKMETVYEKVVMCAAATVAFICQWNDWVCADTWFVLVDVYCWLLPFKRRETNKRMNCFSRGSKRQRAAHEANGKAVAKISFTNKALCCVIILIKPFDSFLSVVHIFQMESHQIETECK